MKKEKVAVMLFHRTAKCKDCKFLVKKRRGHSHNACDNPESKYYETPRTQDDFVCDKWKLINS